MFMEKKRENRGQSGFTLVETLLVSAVIIILLAVSSVAIVKYIHHLQITELDNAAKEISMAAQNRAILLKNSGLLEGCVVKADGSNKMEQVDVSTEADATTQITAYYIHSDDAKIGKLLPEGSIDPALWEGDFYIVYEPVSASVIDVFYGKKELTQVGTDFRSFYDVWRGAAREERMKASPKIGYYGGEAAQSGTAITLRTPLIRIINEETLTAEVTYWIPRTLSSDLQNQIELKTELSYEGAVVPLTPQGAVKTEYTIDYISYTAVYLLDSLETGKQFKDLFTGVLPAPSGFGGDFTLTAEVGPKEETSRQINGARRTAEDNSLFARGSGGETAYLSYMRHLQNLDRDLSGVKGKTAAEQRGDILCAEDYSFLPIINAEVKSYDGKEHEIRGLTIGKAAQDKGRTSFGLFAEITGTGEEAWRFSNVRLVNTVVEGKPDGGDGTGYAGALAGTAQYASFDNCRVYWEKESASVSNLRQQLGDSTAGYQYKITGKTAGGLAGKLTNGRIENCLSAATIEGKGTDSAAGGLLGCAEGSIEIKNSYGDCYLKGSGVGGLAGNVTGNDSVLTLENCYAAGFIDSGEEADLPGSEAAGLCLGEGTVKSENVYSAMLYTMGARNYPLCENKKPGDWKKTWYLDSAFFAPEDEIDITDFGKTYEQLTDPAGFTNLLGDGFEAKNASSTSPYNLQTALSLISYVYPGLKGIPHYGDWGAQFQDGKLVYYEKYADGTYAFNGANLNLLRSEKPVEDGYAVAFQGEASSQQLTVELDVTFQEEDGKEAVKSLNYGMDGLYKVTDKTTAAGSEVTYYLAPLPGEIVNTAYASENFYQKLSFIQKVGEKTYEGRYYYSPHFANTMVEYDSALNPADMAEDLSVEIRTPRHLYMLSSYEEYYAGRHQYGFVQQLDLDYDFYRGYGLFGENKEQPVIGVNGSSPFRNRYFGNYHTIKNVVPVTEDRYLGLFGYSTGTIEDVVYLPGERTITRSGSSQGDFYVGSLAGHNDGMISNCASEGMELDIFVSDYGRIYVGGLAGGNRGTIRNCSAEMARADAEALLSDLYIGGFVGENRSGGTIVRSYGVGRIAVERSRSGAVYACGFGAVNRGSISACYCAADLQAGGGASVYGFSSGASTRCYYLDGGNFRYREKTFTAQYGDAAALGKTWKELTEENQALAESMGLSPDAGAYPYPGAVRNARGEYVHYGEWPVLMELGTVGVYYWEKMENWQEDMHINDSYHFSSICVDLKTGAVSRESTLSSIHDDGGVITDYGYGYYYSKEMDGSSGGIPPVLASEGIGYSVDADGNDIEFDPADENMPSVKEVDAAIEALMEGNYVFRSYPVWKGKGNSGQGLYPVRDKAEGGTFTLSQGEGSYAEFHINPFFAEAVCISRISIDGNVTEYEETLGTEQNPFGVRSVRQLQFINWNWKERNTCTTVQDGKEKADDAHPERRYFGNQEDFMFLSTLVRKEDGTKEGRWNTSFWKQSHDIDGRGLRSESETEGVFDKSYLERRGWDTEDAIVTPIAAYQDFKNNGALTGWFGGRYDGCNYSIKNINITSDCANCVGLFGATLNASLKNIVLYSPKGTNYVAITQEKKNDMGESCWYGLGGLAGLAGTTKEGESIENCSVSGFWIVDSTKSMTHGGGNVGGMVGVCNMNFSKCTAVTKIELGFINGSGYNVRAGGLVGTSLKDITDCYAGGSIELRKKGDFPEPGQELGSRPIFVGGIKGGYYMKDLRVPRPDNKDDYRLGIDTNSTKDSLVKNSYSYVMLPEKKGNIRALYAIGGKGQDDSGGHAMFEDCYFLESSLNNNTVHTDANEANGFVNKDRTDDWPLYKGQNNYEGYTQSSKDKIHRLTWEELAELTLPGFGRVTTVQNGIQINGKYSYANSDALLGMNYPFPTILTQPDNRGGSVNVHYGDWPLPGIGRESGSAPVEVDLFADYKPSSETGESAGKAIKDEKIIFSEHLSDKKGDFEVTSADETIAAGEVKTDPSGDPVLCVEGKAAGSTVLTVTYKISDTESYIMTVPVSVTALLEMRPELERTIVFTDGTSIVRLNAADKNGKEISEELKTAITLTFEAPETDSAYVKTASIKSIPDPADPAQELLLSRELILETAQQAGASMANTGYTYTYQGKEYEGIGVVNLSVVEPEVKPIEGIHLYLEGEAEKSVQYPVESLVTIQVPGTDGSLAPAENLKLQKADRGAFTDLDAECISDNRILELKGYRLPSQEEASGVILLEFSCEYGGASHVRQIYVDVTIHNGKDPAAGIGEVMPDNVTEEPPMPGDTDTAAIPGAGDEENMEASNPKDGDGENAEVPAPEDGGEENQNQEGQNPDTGESRNPEDEEAENSPQPSGDGEDKGNPSPGGLPAEEPEAGEEPGKGGDEKKEESAPAVNDAALPGQEKAKRIGHGEAEEEGGDAE